jgi:hypothetical protein
MEMGSGGFTVSGGWAGGLLDGRNFKNFYEFMNFYEFYVI